MVRNSIVVTLGGLAIACVAIAGGVAEAAVHTVIVQDNFFTPAELAIEVGDTVRWTNSAGFHNVYSCTDTQTGCDGVVANEAFSNGAPRNGPWFYTYTFTAAGENPYVCQSHASFMHGHITVAAPIEPPAVPDGATGEPVTVDKSSPDGVALTIAWDDQTCPAEAVNIVYGSVDDLPAVSGGTYSSEGQVCGVASPFAWAASPELAPGTWVWWLLIATDGAVTEGSWGTSTVGERTGPFADGASGACGVTVKNASGSCVP